MNIETTSSVFMRRTDISGTASSKRREGPQ